MKHVNVPGRGATNATQLYAIGFSWCARERERKRERERIIAGLAFRWKVAADEDREGSRVAENARMRCTMNGASSYWYRWYARSTVHSVNALPFSIRDVARTTMIARDA